MQIDFDGIGMFCLPPSNAARSGSVCIARSYKRTVYNKITRLCLPSKIMARSSRRNLFCLCIIYEAQIKPFNNMPG
eukprot:scaffold15514_cov129-Cylindrotheca_fusiformis.AAC.25